MWPIVLIQVIGRDQERHLNVEAVIVVILTKPEPADQNTSQAVNRNCGPRLTNNAAGGKATVNLVVRERARAVLHPKQ